MEKMSQAMEKVRMLVGIEVEDDRQHVDEESSFAFMDDFNRNCTLSTKQRLYGFVICLVAGLTCTLMSMLVFFNPIKFGIAFTFGNLLSLGSTGFLIGPKRQVNMMLDPVRIYATALYLASIVLALLCALYVHNKLLTLVAIILEFGALIWYSMSYIPFARAMVSKIMEKDTSKMEEIKGAFSKQSINGEPSTVHYASWLLCQSSFIQNRSSPALLGALLCPTNSSYISFSPQYEDKC